MAFPVREGVAISDGTTTDGTSFTPALPSGIVNGEMLVVMVGTDAPNGGANTLSTSSTNWNKIDQVDHTAGFLGFAVFVKRQATGSDTLVVNGTASEQYNSLAFRVSGHRTDQDPTITTFISTANSANPDPPAHTVPSGAKDNLWVAMACANTNPSFSAAPTNYSGLITKQATSIQNDSIAMAFRELNAASDSPSGFTMSLSRAWLSGLMAIEPEGATEVTGDGTSAGAATAAGEGESERAGDGAAAGVAATSGEGESDRTGEGASAGVATATGEGGTAGTTVTGVGASAGAATVSGEGKTDREGDGAAAGAAAAAGQGESDREGDGASTGAATAAGQGESEAAGAGSSAGAATVSGQKEADVEGTGSSAGAASVTGISDSGSVVTGEGSSAGAATAAAEGESEREGSGAVAGAAAVAGQRVSDREGAGASSGAATVSGEGEADKTGSGAASGAGAVTGEGEADVVGSGSSAGAATVDGVSDEAITPVGFSEGATFVLGEGKADVEGIGASAGAAQTYGASSAEVVEPYWRPPFQNLRDTWRTGGGAKLSSTTFILQRIMADEVAQGDIDYVVKELVKRARFHCSAVINSGVLELTSGLSLGAVYPGQRVSFILSGTNAGALTATLDGQPLGNVVNPLYTAVPAGYILNGKLTEGTWDGTQLLLRRLPEFGSNANGDWRRFEDGRQECNMSLATSAAGLLTWTYPQPFAVNNVRHSFEGESATATGFITRFTGRLLASVQYEAYRLDTGARVAVALDMQASGRWF